MMKLDSLASRLRAFLGRMAIAAIVAVAFPADVSAAAASLIELVEHGKKHQGKLEAKGSGVCWLMGRDGKLSPFEIGQIESIRSIGPRFRELSVAELRDQL